MFELVTQSTCSYLLWRLDCVHVYNCGSQALPVACTGSVCSNAVALDLYNICNFNDNHLGAVTAMLLRNVLCRLSCNHVNLRQSVSSHFCAAPSKNVFHHQFTPCHTGQSPQQLTTACSTLLAVDHSSTTDCAKLPKTCIWIV